MFFVNKDFHLDFLRTELKNLLPDGSFASRIWRTVGYEIDNELEAWSDVDDGYSSIFPVEALFVWVTKEGGVDLECLEWTDGIFRDDNDQPLPKSLEPTLSAVEQLAAYGLWLITDDNMNCCGHIPDEGFNDNGFTRELILEHQAERMLLAYQALVFSHRVLQGGELNDEEKERSAKLDFSTLGKSGAAKRHAPMKELRAFAVEKYRSGKWPSANAAAFDLAQTVIDHGRLIGANLTSSNAQRTIAEWFRKSV